MSLGGLDGAVPSSGTCDSDIAWGKGWGGFGKMLAVMGQSGTRKRVCRMRCWMSHGGVLGDEVLCCVN